MKKIICIILVVMILTSCQPKTLEKDDFTIALMISSLDNPFFLELSQYIQLEAEDYNLKLLILDSKDDVIQEEKNYQSFNHVNILILNPVDKNVSSHLVLDANDKSIPVVTIDRQVDQGTVIAHIESDNYKGGLMAGEFLTTILRDDEDVILFEGIKDTSANEERIAGFTQALTDAGIVVKKSVRANFSRQEAYDIAIKDGFLSDGSVVFAANDEMALGVLDAAREHSKYITIIGYDGTNEAVNAVGNGFLAGTIAQRADLIAKETIDAVRAIINNQAIEPLLRVELKLISLSSQ